MRTPTIVIAGILLCAGAGQAQQAKKIDPCSLLSKADVQQATGQQITDPKANTTNAAVCDYRAGAGGILNVVVVPLRAGETADKFVAEAQKRKMQLTEAKGIGDRSFWITQNFGMLQLSTYKGAYNVIITMLLPGSGEAKQKAAAEQMMKKALTKL